MLLLPLLLACQSPEASWPGLVLLDGSAERSGVHFVDRGAPLRTADSPLRVNGVPEVLEADAGELLWVTGELDLESWEVGTDLDPDAVDLVTQTGARPALADALSLPATLDPSTGAWRLEAPEILLTVALSDLDDVLAVLPVPMEEGEGEIGRAAEGTGRRASALAPGPEGPAGPADGTDDDEADPLALPGPPGADDPFALTLGDAAAAALVGLHEAPGGSLLLASDGTWKCHSGNTAEHGIWALDGHMLELDAANGALTLPTSGFQVNLANFPCASRRSP